MTTEPTFRMIPAALIVKATNDRTHFDEAKLMDLAWSIKDNGLAQPLTVRPKGDVFELVAGERRLRAMTEVLGYDEMPCVVHDLNDHEAAAIMLAENTAREDLNPMEESAAYRVRLDKYAWTIDRVAEAAGVSKDIVRKRLSLLGLREEIQQLVRFGNLGLGHAEAMAELDCNRQISALRILQQSEAMPIAMFREVCTQLLDEQKQDVLFDLELTMLEQAKDGVGSWIGGKDAEVDVPTAPDMPALVLKRERGMTAAYAIELYIGQLKAAGMDREAAVIGSLYSGLVKNSLMKPRKRLGKRAPQQLEG